MKKIVFTITGLLTDQSFVVAYAAPLIPIPDANNSVVIILFKIPRCFALLNYFQGLHK